MTDRFKLRVWDKEFKKYWTDGEIKENAAWLLFPDNDNIENIEIEQCTCLKDKNGNLVFEGDLVREDSLNEVFVVVYEENFCGFFSGFVLRRTDETFDSVTPSLLAYSRVIGNVHENKELLK